MGKSITVNSISSVSELMQQPSNSIDCASWDGFAEGPKSSFRIARLDDELHIMFEVEEADPRAEQENDFDQVCQDSCVEFFCRLEGGERYFNFEFNSRGVCLAASRITRKEGRMQLSPVQMAQIQRIPGVTEKGWTLHVVIPISIIDAEAQPPFVLNANFYKCGDKTYTPHYLSWSKIDLPSPNFHCPEFFGQLNID